ncbi:VWA domain-containing protein [Nitrosomonas communis]|uniref:vWA domain-containing protein n=1 Tax=Nitrosomonas communis TaxID=44574 RepID=UPI0026EF5A81|nr:VWA domain-containing protein [Nitrosomonas communis]MCO6427625.1 VWA domain-containing protein [Nitrosomonas communis]
MSERRLPVYLLLDTSGSMRGEPIQSVNVGLHSMVNALRQDPYALESVHLGLITFDIEAKEIFPLTPLEQIQLPEIKVPNSGPTFLGEALKLLAQRSDLEIIKSTPERKGDWRPLLFIMTDGSPSDLQTFRDMIPEIKKRNFGNIIACAAGPKARNEILKELTNNVVHLDTTDSATFSQFFKWVSESVSIGSSSAGVTEPTHLPPPPPEVQVVI